MIQRLEKGYPASHVSREDTDQPVHPLPMSHKALQSMQADRSLL